MYIVFIDSSLLVKVVLHWV